MDANRQNPATPTTARPPFRLVTRDGQKPVMDPPPVPRDEEHPEEPGYGHGV